MSHTVVYLYSQLPRPVRSRHFLLLDTLNLVPARATRRRKPILMPNSIRAFVDQYYDTRIDVVLRAG